MNYPRDRERNRTLALAIMTKAPSEGQVKTRLSPPLTPAEAAFLSTCFLQDTATIIQTATQRGSVQRVALYTPTTAAPFYRELLSSEFLLVPQRGEDLGQRLTCAFEDLFRLGFSAVCLVGSDSPTLPPKTITETIEILAQPEENVVIGPTDDGGYYLIALKKLHRPLFEDIPWSSESVFEQTIQRARKTNLKVHLLPAWYDVDNAASLHRLCEELFGSGKSTRLKNVARETLAYLEKLMREEGHERIWPGGANL